MFSLQIVDTDFMLFGWNLSVLSIVKNTRFPLFAYLFIQKYLWTETFIRLQIFKLLLHRLKK